MFSPAELQRLATCDPRLQLLLRELDTFVPFTLLQGGRSAEEEAANIASGRSHTNHSKHVMVPSLAVDIAPKPVLWPDEAGIAPAEATYRLKRFHVLAGLVLGLAHARGLNIRWGGDWDSDFDFKDQTFNDLPHFEIKDAP